MTGITSIGLYRNVERVLADLDAAGLGADRTLRVDDLTPYDQFHYEGTEAVDDAIEALEIGPSSNVIDVGSGLGGPARHIADRTTARVTALELQDDVHKTATMLTTRCGLEDSVTHVRGDVLAGDAGVDTFTGLVSMLCFLHIADREALFRNCARALVPGANMFIDDYYELEPFTAEERQALADTVHCSDLPDLGTYRADVAGAGFEVVDTIDKTADWTAFVTERLDLFRAGRSELVDRYDVETVDSLDHFYSTVADLFTGGRLGGLRLIARLRD